jgi:hypothetical protein
MGLAGWKSQDNLLRTVDMTDGVLLRPGRPGDAPIRNSYFVFSKELRPFPSMLLFHDRLSVIVIIILGLVLCCTTVEAPQSLLECQGFMPRRGTTMSPMSSYEYHPKFSLPFLLVLTLFEPSSLRLQAPSSKPSNEDSLRSTRPSAHLANPFVSCLDSIILLLES